MVQRYSMPIDKVQGKAAHDAAAAGNPVRMGGVYRTTLAGVAAGDVVDLFLDAAGRMQTALPGTITSDADATNDNPDKTVTVPTGKQWQLISIHVYYAATGTSGNRWLRPVIKVGGTSNIVIIDPPSVITANESWCVMYMAGCGASTYEHAVANTWVMSLPVGLWLDAADTVQLTDSSGIDTNDDMAVYLNYLERDSA